MSRNNTTIHNNQHADLYAHVDLETVSGIYKSLASSQRPQDDFEHIVKTTQIVEVSYDGNNRNSETLTKLQARLNELFQRKLFILMNDQTTKPELSKAAQRALNFAIAASPLLVSELANNSVQPITAGPSIFAANAPQTGVIEDPVGDLNFADITFGYSSSEE